MLLLGIFILVPAIFAADYNNYGNHRPNNDGANINPSSNLVFNFEQLRMDQPPQVEMREENMGRYMYRPTTTAVPVVPETRHVNRPIENHPDHFSQYSNILPPVPNRYNQEWNPTSMQSSTMPPPPSAPKFDDFSESFNNHAFSYFEPSPPNPAHNLPASRDFYQSRNSNQVNNGNSRNSMQPAAPQYNMPVQPVSTTSIPSRQDINRRFEQFTSRNSSPNREQQSTVNRGNHKFSWNDLTTVQPQYNPAPQQPSSIVPPTANQNRGPPPPAPTLSPWNDGLGK